LTSTRALPRVLTLGAAVLIVVAACSQAPGASVAPSTGGGTGGSYAEFVPDPTLLAAAKAEGTLTTIALPHDWCNYGQIEGAAPNPNNVIDIFKARTGLAVNELNPLAGSGDEIEAVKANKDNKGPQAPDVLDIGLAFGPSAKAEGLLMPYKVATWDTIPADVKDADGAWYGDYYGVFSFEVNKTLVPNVPKDWPDLLKPEYKGKIALPGDPRASSQAILAVFASGLANGGSLDDATKGLDFFKQLKDNGNLIPGVIANATTVANGETPMPRRLPVVRRSRSSSRPAAASVACTSRRSAPTHRTRMPRSSGRSSCTPTRARTCGCAGTATRSGTRIWSRTTRSRRSSSRSFPT
jgi:putative spermidine/putrescine transport system substrate-binding protein